MNNSLKTKIVVSFLCLLLFQIKGFATYNEALNLFLKGRYSESLKKVAEILTVADDLKPDSKNYQLRYLAAHNHWQLGNYDSAIAHLRRCMDIRKDSSDPYVDIALIMIEKKRYREAEAVARKGLRIKADAMLYYILGTTAMNSKNYWRAKALFEKANSIDSENYIIYNDLGIALMNLKRYSHANTAFSVAWALNPESPEILNNLGASFEKMGKYKKAYEYYNKALGFSMNNIIIKKNIKRVKIRAK